MGNLRGLATSVLAFVVVLAVAGCPATAEKPPAAGQSHDGEPAKKPQPFADTNKPPNQRIPASSEQPVEVEKAPDLGAPLVDNPASLKRLAPDSPVWIDVANQRVIVMGQICQTEAPLEMFACLRNTKEHEAIVAVPTEAYLVHAGLLAVGAKAGRPVQFVPEYVPATGSEIDIAVRWKNDRGETQTARAQDWVRDVKSGKAMDAAWVFGGSGFWLDEATGQRHYQAEGGDLICVANFTTAMLDLAIPSSQSNAELSFQAFTERIPPRETPVTILLTPKREETGPKGTQSLMMMVPPELVIQEEEEARIVTEAPELEGKTSAK